MSVFPLTRRSVPKKENRKEKRPGGRAIPPPGRMSRAGRLPGLALVLVLLPAPAPLAARPGGTPRAACVRVGESTAFCGAPGASRIADALRGGMRRTDSQAACMTPGGRPAVDRYAMPTRRLECAAGLLLHPRTSPTPGARNITEELAESQVPAHRFVVRKAGVSSSSAGRSSLPDMRRERNVDRLLDMIGRFVMNDTRWALSAEDAAVSLHCLYRAARSSPTPAHSGARGVRRQRSGSVPAAQPVADISRTSVANRQQVTMTVLGLAVADGIQSSTLKPKYLSMALTSLSDQARHHKAYQDVFHKASERIQDMARKSAYTSVRTRRDLPQRAGGAQDTHEFTAKTISMLATAFIKSEVADPKVFEALAILIKQLPPERWSARPLGMVLKSFARAGALSEADLLKHLCLALVRQPVEDFDAQSCTDVVFALARLAARQDIARGWEGDERDQALQHIVTAILALNFDELAGGEKGGSPRAASTLAALCSSLVSARVTDAAVFDKLSLVLQRMDPQHFSLQSIATLMHAYASAGRSDKELIQAMTSILLRVPLRTVEARAAANIAWSAAVEGSTDPALLCWIWRSLDVLLPSMQADGLSQVHQFLLHAQLGNFTREDVFTAFYGTRAAPPAVRQTFNAMEESAEQRCRREFINESEAQRRVQASSRLHEDVSAVLFHVAPSVLPALSSHTRDAGVEKCGWLVQEYVDGVSGYSIDMLIPSHSIAVEVDG